MNNDNIDDRYHTTSWDGRQVQRAAGHSAGQSRKKKKKRRTNPLLAIVLWLAIVAASSAICAGVGWMLANDFAALNKPYKEVDFEVKEEWVASVEEETKENGEKKETTYYDMSQVAKALEKEGLIEYSWFFRLFCAFTHADAKITQGKFALNTNMDYMALIRGMRMRGGTAETVDVAIPEGYTVSQIIELLAENGVGSEEDLAEIAENYVFEDYEFVDNENLGSLSRLEGYLFPDTYNFYVGARPELAFNAMLSNFKTKVYNNEDLTELFGESEYSLPEIITIASLVERETDGGDRDKIASVIYNRLENDGETNRLLQIDAALPPTPMAKPGRAAIRAALMPADTDYYFYVLDPESKQHVFSETLAQHNKAVAEAAAKAEN